MAALDLRLPLTLMSVLKVDQSSAMCTTCDKEHTAVWSYVCVLVQYFRLRAWGKGGGGGIWLQKPTPLHMQISQQALGHKGIPLSIRQDRDLPKERSAEMGRRVMWVHVYQERDAIHKQ